MSEPVLFSPFQIKSKTVTKDFIPAVFIRGKYKTGK